MGLYPTSVNPNGLTALINHLGRDCTPDQFVREFVQNSLEAIGRLKCEEPGRVLVDFHQLLYETNNHYKLCFTDNGDGMDPDQMQELLNKLSASGHSNEFENYGIGAKISALSRNKAGILYESWKNGKGHYCYIYFDESAQQYGMKGIEHEGQTVYVAPRTDDCKPEIVQSHGTRVTLFGNTFEANTITKPEGVSGAEDSWLVYYLNSRFFRFPRNVELSARVGYYREDNPKHNYMAKVCGQEATLTKFAKCHGKIAISDAVVHWWILSRDRDGHGREYTLGHTATLHNNEILDRADGRSSRAALFGVYMGAGDVVLYVEPDRTYVQKTSRTNLVKQDGSPLPWENWADEFRKAMPRELREYVDSIASQSAQKSHEENIRARLKELGLLLRVSKYRPIQGGTRMASDGESNETTAGHTILRPRIGARRNRPVSDPNSTVDSLLHILSKDVGVPSEEIERL